MKNDIFIPCNITELYDKMISEQFKGQLLLEKDYLIWRLPNGVIVKAAFTPPFREGYIETCYMEGKREIQLTHWHPAVEDFYRDLYQIHTSQTFWVKKKKTIFKNPPLIMDESKWGRYNEKKKNKYIILQY